MAGMDGLPEAVANRIIESFKALDKDGNLKISKQEYENSILEPYVNNGYNLVGPHSQGETIGDLLANADKQFDAANANKDYGLNIDEYTDMVKDRYLAEWRAEGEPTEKVVDDDREPTPSTIPDEQPDSQRNITPHSTKDKDGEASSFGL